MDRHECFYTNRAPLFDGSNYAFWTIRMRNFLIYLRFYIWSVVNNGYTNPTTPPIDATRKRLGDNDAKSMNENLCGLEDL